MMLGRSLWQAIRTLLRRPAHVGLVVLTLAVGLGASVAVLSIETGVLRKPLPVRDQDRLVLVEAFVPGSPDPNPMPLVDVQALAKEPLFDAGAGVQYDGPISLPVKLGDHAFLARTTGINGDFFRLLDVKPALGRLIQWAGDYSPDHEAVLSYGLWQRQFGGDPNVIGKTITVYQTFTIVGVAPRDLDFPHRTELWATFNHKPEERAKRTFAAFSAVLRLKDGHSVAEAGAAARSFFVRRENDLIPDEPRGQVPRTAPMIDVVVGDFKSSVEAFVVGVALLFGLAIANAAGLELIKGTNRARELALRSALGADRGRLIRQLVLESGAVAAIGTAAGLIVAIVGVAAIARNAPAEIPRLSLVRVDWSTAIKGFGLGIVATTLFGLGSATWLTRKSSFENLRGAGPQAGPGSTHRAQETLLVAQVALAVALTAGAGLLLRSWRAMQTLDLGFDSKNLTVLHVPTTTVIDSTDHGARVAQFHDALLRRLEATPGVESVGGTTLRPFAGTDGWTSFWTAEGQDPETARTNSMADNDGVTLGFFRTLGIPLLAGRTFLEADATGPRVAIVNQGLARRAWPGQSAIGRRIKLTPIDKESDWYEIIGVVGDNRYRRLTETPATIYFPVFGSQAPEFRQEFWAVRTSLSTAALIDLARGYVRELDSTTTVFDASGVESSRSTTLARPRFNALLLLVFAIGALILTAIGTFGVVSAFVQQRVREIGIRLAVGAGVPEVRALVMARALRLTGGGIAIGLAIAILGARLTSGLLFRIPSFDPLTLSTVAILTLGMTLIACLGPLRIATKVDPLTILKSDC